MSTVILTKRWELESVANASLEAATRLWFVVAVAGQWVFFYYLVAFYGTSMLTGHLEAWNKNKFLQKGYVAGDTLGNLSFALHVILAAIVTFGGALQLVPRLRARAPSFHRWNGRLFLTTAMAASFTGLYMTWMRGATRSLDGALALTLNTALIFVFAALAWRSARAGDVAAHRRWALRSYLVANGVWILRIGFMAWAVLSRGRGVGAFYRVWEFGCYLLPLGMLELYFRAQERNGPGGRLAMAGGLFVVAVLMVVGTFAFSMFVRPILAR